MASQSEIAKLAQQFGLSEQAVKDQIRGSSYNYGLKVLKNNAAKSNTTVASPDIFDPAVSMKQATKEAQALYAPQITTTNSYYDTMLKNISEAQTKGLGTLKSGWAGSETLPSSGFYQQQRSDVVSQGLTATTQNETQRAADLARIASETIQSARSAYNQGLTATQTAQDMKIKQQAYDINAANASMPAALKEVDLGGQVAFVDSQGNVIKTMNKTKSPSSGSGSSTTALSAQKSSALSQASQALNQSKGSDGYVNTASYKDLLNQYTILFPGQVSEFLNTFPPEMFLNPQDTTANSVRNLKTSNLSTNTSMNFNY